MKNLILLFLISFSTTIFAQQGKNTFNVQETLQNIKAKVNLTPEQETKVLVLINNKMNNIDDVLPLRTTDIEKYIAKRNAIDSGMHFSIKRLLDKNQRSDFQKYLNEIRLNKANLKNTMKKEGKSMMEMNLAAAEL